MTVIGIERIRDELSKLKPELKKPWVILDRLPYIHATDDPNAKPYSTPVVGRFDYMESADYIMACNPDAMSNVLSYVASLKAERDAAMKDAERYRWLRDATPWTAISAFDKTRVAFRLASKFSEEAQDTGVDLDKAIDAAIAKAEGRTE